MHSHAEVIIVTWRLRQSVSCDVLESKTLEQGLQTTTDGPSPASEEILSIMKK